MIRVSNIRIEPGEEITTELIAEKTGIKDIESWHFYKKSIDARRKTDVHYLCTVDISAKNEKKD